MAEEAPWEMYGGAAVAESDENGPWKQYQAAASPPADQKPWEMFGGEVQAEGSSSTFDKARYAAVKGAAETVAAIGSGMKNLDDIGPLPNSFDSFRRAQVIADHNPDFMNVKLSESELTGMAQLRDAHEAWRAGLLAPDVAIEEAGKSVAQGASALEKETPGAHWVAKGSELAGGMLPYLLTGPAAPITGGLATYGNTYNQAFEYYKHQGMSDEDARKTASHDATVSGLTTMDTFLLLPGVGKNAAERLLSKHLEKAAPLVRAAVNTLAAGAQGSTVMAADTLLRDAQAMQSYRPEMTFGDALQDTAKNALVGFAATAGMHGAGESVNALLGAAKNKLNPAESGSLSVPVPETDATVKAQMQWLEDGKRKAVLVTPGEGMPEIPSGMKLHETDAGVFVYDPKQTTPEQIEAHLADDTVGDLLGYGVARKPPEGTPAASVTILDKDGNEKQAVATDAATVPSVVEAASALTGPGDQVRVESPADVIAARLKTELPMDPVESMLDGWIDKTSALSGKVLEGISGAPIWLSKAAVNGALRVVRMAYVNSRNLGMAIGEGVEHLRRLELSGFKEEDARAWLEQLLAGDAATQSGGKVIGAATQSAAPTEHTTPDAFAGGHDTTSLPMQQDMASAATGMGWRQRVSGWFGAMAGETFPRTTRLVRELGEQGARWISSRQSAKPLAEAFVHDVMRGLNLDNVEFGAALHEDNLRQIKQETQQRAEELAAAGDAEGAAKLRDQAKNVFTFVGDKGVFADEAAYQKYLKRGDVQLALERHRQLWGKLVEPMYKEAMKMDPGTELPGRGLQTGARINLNFVREGEPSPKDTFVSSAAKGVLSNVLQRKSPFGKLAKGTAAAYAPGYGEAMRNTYARQLEVANRNRFDRMMVQRGHAVIDKPGQQITIGSEGTTPFEIKRQVLQADGKTIPQFKNIYVRNSIAAEYRKALNLDAPSRIPIATPLAKLANTLAISGLTEVTAHVSNLSHALFWRPGVTQNFWSEIGLATLGRADLFLALTRAMAKTSAEDTVRLKELSEIGALREGHPARSPWNPLAWGSKMIEKADTHTRLQLDRMYQNLAEQGLVPKTETARREFVNQVGQYNRRAQGPAMTWMRDTGLAPFVTAGRAFNVLALRTALLKPGVESTSTAARIAMGATIAAKITGVLTLAAVANYLLTREKGGGVAGRPGVPIGAIDLGVNDKNGKPLTFDLANVLGLRRAMRVTGVRGGVEALRNHLPIGVVLDSVYRDLQNSWMAPITGPVSRTLSIGFTGQQPGVGIPRTAPIVPPGQSQAAENWKTAGVELSPITAGIHDSMQPGSTGYEWAQKQLGRFTLQPAKPMTMMRDYAGIVRRAQTSAFLDDVIMRSRKMNIQDRMPYLRQSLQQIDPRERESSVRRLQERGVLPR